jgi:hypothetical protein
MAKNFFAGVIVLSVEQKTNNSKFKGSNPACAGMKRKLEKNFLCGCDSAVGRTKDY